MSNSLYIAKYTYIPRHFLSLPASTWLLRKYISKISFECFLLLFFCCLRVDVHSGFDVSMPHHGLDYLVLKVQILPTKATHSPIRQPVPRRSSIKVTTEMENRIAFITASFALSLPHKYQISTSVSIIKTAPLSHFSYNIINRCIVRVIFP